MIALPGRKIGLTISKGGSSLQIRQENLHRKTRLTDLKGAIFLKDPLTGNQG